jgi:elongation factor G
MGELHLEIIKLRLTRDYKVDVVVGKPKVSYPRDDHRQGRGRVGQAREAVGGRGQYGTA